MEPEIGITRRGTPRISGSLQNLEERHEMDSPWSFQREPTLPAPQFQSSGLYNCEPISFCLNHRVCGNLLWLPQDTDNDTQQVRDRSRDWKPGLLNSHSLPLALYHALPLNLGLAQEQSTSKLALFVMSQWACY